MVDLLESKVRQALETRLVAFVPVVTSPVTPALPTKIKWEGMPFTQPGTGTAAVEPWARATLRRAGTNPVAFGGQREIEHVGTFLVDLLFPVEAGAGRGKAERLGDGLRRHFHAGAEMTKDDVTVTVRRVRCGSVQEFNTEFVMLPISIEYWVRGPNN